MRYPFLRNEQIDVKGKRLLFRHNSNNDNFFNYLNFGLYDTLKKTKHNAYTYFYQNDFEILIIS